MQYTTSNLWVSLWNIFYSYFKASSSPSFLSSLCWGCTPHRIVVELYLKTESVGKPRPRDMSTITTPLTTHLSFYKAFSSQPFIREASTAQALNVHTSFESFFRKSFKARRTVQNVFFSKIVVTSKEISKRGNDATCVIIRENAENRV